MKVLDPSTPWQAAGKGPSDQKIRKVHGLAAGAEACGNQFLTDFGKGSHTPGALPKAGAADFKGYAQSRWPLC